MDSRYGMYRTLFRAGYPFSYDLDDLARYYIAYSRLMTHWRDVIPGALLDIRYEALFDDPETVSRQILEYCGLDWEDGCLAFHRNTAPIATASAAQVRRPLYRDAVGRWRRYASRLQPPADRLESAGVARPSMILRQSRRGRPGLDDRLRVRQRRQPLSMDVGRARVEPHSSILPAIREFAMTDAPTTHLHRVSADGFAARIFLAFLATAGSDPCCPTGVGADPDYS
ncbi:MAG: sulfotransferase [Woeseiaceae bacterium]|nr:sulfotransferase [Woeseiaceae bacterium]